MEIHSVSIHFADLLMGKRLGVGKYLQDSGLRGTFGAVRILRNSKEYKGISRNTQRGGSSGATEPGAVEAGAGFL